MIAKQEPSPFGGMLRCYRDDLDLSLREAAEIIGCTKAHLWELERGKSTNPTIRTLAQIACAYEVDLGNLATAAACCCPDSGYRAGPSALSASDKTKE